MCLSTWKIYNRNNKMCKCWTKNLTSKLFIMAKHLRLYVCILVMNGPQCVFWTLEQQYLLYVCISTYINKMHKIFNIFHNLLCETFQMKFTLMMFDLKLTSLLYPHGGYIDTCKWFQSFVHYISFWP